MNHCIVSGEHGFEKNCANTVIQHFIHSITEHDCILVELHAY